MPHKVPESVLVVIHSPDMQILLLERADHPGFWQSVTGSKDTPDEPAAQTAVREVFEETGIRAHLPPAGAAGQPDARMCLRDLQHSIQYEIFQHWRWRYAPGVTHNTEHWFSLCVPIDVPVVLAPREHLQSRWLPWEAAAGCCFSWSNSDAIRMLASGRFG